MKLFLLLFFSVSNIIHFSPSIVLEIFHWTHGLQQRLSHPWVIVSIVVLLGKDGRKLLFCHVDDITLTPGNSLVIQIVLQQQSIFCSGVLNKHIYVSPHHSFLIFILLILWPLPFVLHSRLIPQLSLRETELLFWSLHSAFQTLYWILKQLKSIFSRSLQVVFTINYPIYVS